MFSCEFDQSHIRKAHISFEVVFVDFALFPVIHVHFDNVAIFQFRRESEAARLAPITPIRVTLEQKFGISRFEPRDTISFLIQIVAPGS